MMHFFSAFIFVGIMLEMFEINNMRLSSLKRRTFSNATTSLLLTTLIYGAFLIAGWFSSNLVEEIVNVYKREIVTGIVVVMVLYAYLRRNRYNEAGQFIYGSFPLFSLILIARGILHILSGFCISFYMTSFQTFLLSYGWGVILFSIAVLLSKNSPVKIFGIPIGYVKMLAYSLSIIFIYI